MYGIIYITECIDPSCECYGKKYIGQHKTDSLEFDGYLGSGKLLCRYLDKYGVDKFRRVTLKICESKEELDSSEKEYISEFDAMNSPDFLNLHEGGSGGWKYYNESDHEHPRGMLGKTQTDYQRSHQSKFMMGNKIAEGSKGRLGQKSSVETCKRISDSLKGRTAPNKGIPMSDSQREYLSAVMSKYYEDHPEAREDRSRLLSKQNEGRVWITNGVDNKFIYEEDLSSYPGYRPGRLCTNEGKIGTVFINNGEVNKQIPGDIQIPEGWVRGMLKKSGWKKQEKEVIL